MVICGLDALCDNRMFVACHLDFKSAWRLMFERGLGAHVTVHALAPPKNTPSHKWSTF